MELKLQDGRYVFDRSGALQTVEGREELLQRARMRLAAHRGSFWPDPEYGSRLYLLGRLKPAQRASAAKLYAAEALKPETELSVGAVEYTPLSDGCAAVSVELLLSDGTAKLSLTI